jgi:hypothetical protein
VAQVGNLKRISQTLGSYSTEPSSLFTLAAEKRAAEEELFDLVEADPGLRGIMARFGASRKDLQEAYWWLLKIGAGQ